jgi:hypothetical protein
MRHQCEQHRRTIASREMSMCIGDALMARFRDDAPLHAEDLKAAATRRPNDEFDSFSGVFVN